MHLLDLVISILDMQKFSSGGLSSRSDGCGNNKTSLPLHEHQNHKRLNQKNLGWIICWEDIKLGNRLFGKKWLPKLA